MPNNLDLAALIRCLEVMADKEHWIDRELGQHSDLEGFEPYEVAKEALHYVNFMLAATKDYESDFEK